jgi:alpha-1,3-glucan synthase
MNALFSYLHQEYYRQTPPKVPSFLKTLFRRKLVLWFLASEILRDYWLSGVSLGHLLFGLNYILTRYEAVWS